MTTLKFGMGAVISEGRIKKSGGEEKRLSKTNRTAPDHPLSN
jgi:hypothetical protein